MVNTEHLPHPSELTVQQQQMVAAHIIDLSVNTKGMVVATELVASANNPPARRRVGVGRYPRQAIERMLHDTVDAD